MDDEGIELDTLTPSATKNNADVEPLAHSDCMLKTCEFFIGTLMVVLGVGFLFSWG